RLNMVAREALTMAWNAMQGEIFRTAGSSLAKNGQRLERIFRDMSMGWGHFGTIVGDWAAREWAREHLGVAPEAPPRPQQEHGTGGRGRASSGVAEGQPEPLAETRDRLGLEVDCVLLAEVPHCLRARLGGAACIDELLEELLEARGGDDLEDATLVRA